MSYSIPRAAALNITSYIYLLIASLVTMPSLIAALGLTQFAQYILSLGILSLLTSLDLGLSRSVVYHLAKRGQSSVESILTSSLVLHATLGLIYGIGAATLYSPALGVLVFLTYLLSHTQTWPESQGNFVLVNIRAVLIGTANTIGALTVANLGYGVGEILILLSTTTLITTVIMMILSQQRLPRTLVSASHRLLLTYGLKTQFGKLTNAVQAQYPKLLLASSPLALTIFGISSNIVGKLVGAVTQLSIAYFPHASSGVRSGIFVRYYINAQLILLIMGMAGVILYSFVGHAFLIWWLQDTTLALDVDSFIRTYRYYGLLLLLTPLASTLLDSANRPGTSSLYGALALLIELAIVYMYYPSIGLEAVAYGSVVSLMVMVPILLVTTQKTLSSVRN